MDDLWFISAQSLNTTSPYSINNYTLMIEQSTLVEFKDTFNQTDETKELIEVLRFGNMANGKWKVFMDSTSEHIKTIRITGEFKLYLNHVPLILKGIEHINFPYLTDLNVWGNNIKSIEGLSRIFMPLLKILSIWENQIVFMASLRKGHWPNLQVLMTEVNKNNEINFLSELITNKLTRIDVDENQGTNFSKIDGKIIFKIEAPNLKSIAIAQSQRIVLRRKFRQLSD